VLTKQFHLILLWKLCNFTFLGYYHCILVVNFSPTQKRRINYRRPPICTVRADTPAWFWALGVLKLSVFPNEPLNGQSQPVLPINCLIFSLLDDSRMSTFQRNQQPLYSGRSRREQIWCWHLKHSTEMKLWKTPERNTELCTTSGSSVINTVTCLVNRDGLWVGRGIYWTLENRNYYR
jgi:hypothetical protein